MSEGWLDDADMPTYSHTHQHREDQSPAMRINADESTLTMMNEEGYWWIADPNDWEEIEVSEIRIKPGDRPEAISELEDDLPSLNDFVEAYEAYDGDNVGLLIHEWEILLGLAPEIERRDDTLGSNGRCDTCGAAMDTATCPVDPAHETALP